MMKIKFLFLLILLTQLAIAQQFNISNQKTIGGNLYDGLNDAIILDNSQILIGGSTLSDISYDKTVASYGASDGWVIKLDSSFSIIWQKELGGTGDDDAKKLLYLSDGNYLCVCFSSSPVSGNKIIDSIGGTDIWVVKLDTAGNILWQNVYGGTLYEYYYLSAVELPDKSIVIGCETNSDSSGTKTENSRGGYDYWVFKIDSAGNQLWDKTIGGTGTDELVDLVANPNGNILLTGTSDSPISGEKTEDTYGWEDYWLVELGSNGNILWDKTFGGNDMDYAVGKAIYYNHAYYISGMSYSTISGNKTDTSFGNGDYWLIKVNEQGQKIWDNSFGGSSYEISRSITLTSQSNIIITGTSTSSISGNKTESNKGLGDYWALLLDTNGIILTQMDIGGTDDEGYNVILEKSPGNIILAGSSKSGISGDKTDFCRGNLDYWIVELNMTVGLEPVFANSQKMVVYPNPARDVVNFAYPNMHEAQVIELYNVQGIKVKSIKFKGQSKQSINVADLPAGLYLYRIKGKETVLQSGKFIKE